MQPHSECPAARRTPKRADPALPEGQRSARCARRHAPRPQPQRLDSGEGTPYRCKPLTRALHATLMGAAIATGGETVVFGARAAETRFNAAPRKTYALPPGRLDVALSSFAQISGLQISFDPALTAGKRTSGLAGTYSGREALTALLAGTGLKANAMGDQTFVILAGSDAGPAAPEAEPAVELDPITVTAQPLDQGFKADTQETATKTPMSIRETPQSISVVTQDSLKARQVIEVGQALETAAGVTVVSGAGAFAGRDLFGHGTIQIRGNSANVREDGFNTPFFSARPDLAVYERVEVLKGPSSTLYGRSNAGGFVNFVRKRPLPEFHAEVAPSIGSFDFYRLDSDVTGALFESEAARGRMVVAYEDSGSFIDELESERVVAAPSVAFDITDSTRLLLQGTYQRDEFIPSNGFGLVRDGDSFRAPDVRRSLHFGIPSEEESTVDILSGTAQLEQELGDRWLATLRVNRSDTRRRSNTGAYAYGFREEGDDPTTPEIERRGDVGLYQSALEFDTDVWSGELRLQGRLDLLGRPSTLVLGVDHYKQEFIQDLAFGYVDGPGIANIYANNFSDFTLRPGLPEFRDATSENDSTGVYGQFQIRPFKRLSVLVGGRYDWSDTSYVSRLTDFSDTESIDEDKAEAFTGRVGITFDVSQKISVYGLFAESFDPVLSAGMGGTILEPETGEIFEAGIKTEWLDGRLGINAAIYRLDRDNIPIPAPTAPGDEPFSISSGLQRSEGFELEINGEPLPGWNLSVAGTLLDARFTERDDPNFGSIPSGSADWQVGLFSSYELQGGPLKGLGLGAGLFAIDERGLLFADGGTLEGYERADLSAFYNGFKHFKIALQVRNVFDERYVEVADLANSRAQFGSPTAVLLTVRYDFGD